MTKKKRVCIQFKTAVHGELNRNAETVSHLIDFTLDTILLLYIFFYSAGNANPTNDAFKAMTEMETSNLPTNQSHTYGCCKD